MLQLGGVLLNLFAQPRLMNGDGQLQAEFADDVQMIRVVSVWPRCAHIQRADKFAVHDQRRGQDSRDGGAVRVGKELSEYDRALLMYKLEEVEISDIPSDASQALRDELGTNVTSLVSLTLTRDKRDSIYNPTSGYYLSGTGEFAGGFLAGDKDFWRLHGTASKFIPHWEEYVLELKARAGVADAHGDSERVPIYERYFAGGANTIRGYKERRVGPRDPGNNDPIGGESFWVLNAEETFPVVPDLIKGAVFFDTGNAYERIEDFGTDDIFSGVGAGVRVKTPIGPVKLDMGYPLDDVPGEKKKVRFYFNISQGF